MLKSLLALLIIASSAFAINASGVGYSIGTFGTAYQGDLGNGTAYEMRMQLHTNPVTDNALSPLYMARVGFFGRPIIPTPPSPSIPSGGSYPANAGNQTGGIIRNPYVNEDNVTLAMDILFLAGIAYAKRKEIYGKVAGV